ncbi:MAG: hypothetical protein JXR84_23450, partial [Anaerolineae bacterium]|nr:hypothetical protein [Anaerolineae bacterium]
LLYDGALQGLAEKLAPFKLIRLALRNGHTEEEILRSAQNDGRAQNDGVNVEMLEYDDNHFTLRVPRAETPAIAARLLNTLPVVDFAVEDPPIEAVIDQIYQEGKVEV